MMREEKKMHAGPECRTERINPPRCESDCRDCEYEPGAWERLLFRLHCARRWVLTWCWGCGKPERILGRKVGNHWACFPW